MNSHGAELYLDLMERVLANVIYEDAPVGWYGDLDGYDSSTRSEGRDLPTAAHTMVGLKRLKNVRWCVERVLRDGIPGDLIETGVWRGGVCILMRAVLEAYGVRDRRVWVADSFEGVPVTHSGSHPLDREMALHRINQVLSVSREEVSANFSRYGLLDDQVRFLEGWFSDTLADAPAGPLAVMRLDGDLYESTTDALTCLYPRLSPGGFVVIDDYNIEPCRKAVEEYRNRHGIDEPVQAIDGYGVYWRRAERR
ncbi:TylF/MycF family methyltransferase [Streptomyces minutiscleroticus]|uniref:Methyltransferase MtfB n=3 Tax=Streptomyces TaxID=1883 RepID=A0A918NM11_9ACTN|nr:TylF/MycF family methyltransferase [Streptomyces minutiscleroticus]AGG12560.1 sugar O-methlytransferase [Streptomyces sp. 275]AXB74570.1 sugar O-methyltransferase [Streptomyces roseiscleroticus]GGX79937.1 methyltransferase MtfB [Streptomyces minutiscleroticus]